MSAVSLNCGYTYVPQRVGPKGHTKYTVYWRNCSMWKGASVMIERWLAPDTGCKYAAPGATVTWVFGSTYGIGSPSGWRYC